MITEKDLHEAIAECQGQRNPNANTCLKLASYYTILDHVQESRPVLPTQSYAPRYSYAAPEETTETLIDYNSGSDFAKLINRRDARSVWAVMDELMSVLQVTHPRLYDGTMNQIRDSL